MTALAHRMTAVVALARRVPGWAIDVGMFAVAAAETIFILQLWNIRDLTTIIVSWIGAVGVLAARRWPHLALAAALPGQLTTTIASPALIGLFFAGVRSRRWWTPWLWIMPLTYATLISWPSMDWTFLGADRLSLAINNLAGFVAPLLLGVLFQARRQLANQLAALTAAQDKERELIAASAVDRERARLAREMHDVVSHQVSLMAVHSAALSVSTTDPAAQQAAQTLRGLCVRTLDELRAMVSVLRAATGQAGTLLPQPTLANLDQLLTDSELSATLVGTPPGGLSAPEQRAFYRTVQEALTNIRKHAPGASATVRFWTEEHRVGVRVTNTAPQGPSMELPGSRLGLLGLRERAQLLGGGLHTDSRPDGGYVVEMWLPRPVG